MSKSLLDEIKGKRLLFMGAVGYFCDAVKQARDMGIYTVVTDYIPNSPAKAYADKAVDVSTTDIDALENLVKEEKIDGVFVAWSDNNHYAAEELCRRLKLPFYATKEQLLTFTNKELFKEACNKFGVSVVPQFNLTSELKKDDVNALEFPVIIKPSDSYGGRGITICHSENELGGAVEEALSQSKSKRFITEKYMDDEHYDTMCLYYTIQDGIPALSAMTDRYMQEFAGGKRLNTAIFYPSQYLSRFLSNSMNEKIKNMLKGLGVQNGTIFLEGCVNADDFYLWESGFRLCGAQQNIFPAYFNGVDVQKMLICHALTGKMADEDLMCKEDPYFGGGAACNGLVFLRPGKITSIEGLDEIKGMDSVISFTQLLRNGDSVKESDVGTLNQSFARFHAVAKSREELCEIIDNIFKKLVIKDESGDNMVICSYDYNEILRDKRWA